MPATPRGRIGLPDQRTLLGWLFAFRISLATLLLVRASFVWSNAPENSFYVAAGVLLFFVITGYGAYQVLLKRLEPGVGFFITQALADLGVVSGLVRVGGEASTALAAMYVVVIAVYALLLPTWAGLTVAVGKFPLSANGKALALGETEGFIKIVADAKTDECLGAQMIGAEVTELIGEAVLLQTMEGTPLELRTSIHPHPTVSEAVMEAAAAVYGEAIHI